MPDFSKWGITPDDVGGNQPTQSVSEPDFNTKWLGEPVASEATPVKTTTETPKKPFTLADTWPARLAREISGYLVAPGRALQSTPENPVTTEQLIEPATGLASIIGTGGVPSVVGAAKQLVNPEVARLAALARDKFGIPIRGSQISENPTIRWLDAIMPNQPLSGIAKSNVAQNTAFDKALASQMGVNADRVTMPVIKQFKKDYGQAIDDVATQVGRLKPDDALHNDFMRVYKDAITNIPDKAEAIKNKILAVGDAIENNGGELPAETYKGLMRRKGPLDPSLHKSDGSVAHYTEELQGVMKDFLKRNAPEDMVAHLDMWNKRYAVMKTIEPLVKKSPTGSVSPPTLMNKVQDWSGDLHDLGAIGQMIKPMASSGTSERLNMMQRLRIPAALGGAEGAMLWYDPVLAAKLTAGAAVAGGAKLATNALIGGLLRREGYANKLINSAVPGRNAPNLLQKLVNSNMPYIPPAVVPPFALPAYQQ